MANPVKSQWQFGELFPPEQTRKVYSVAELTSRLRRLLEKEIGIVWVSGEVTNLRVQPSGHIYFTLKDASAQVSCVLFRGESQVRRDVLQDGRHLVVRGELTVYEPRGQYQLRVVAVELQGLGALQAAFEQLKQKLKAEGLFAPERKRAMPRFPQRIGIVTSPAGAAIRDVLHVVQRRNPALEIIVAPCRVQGEGSAAEISAAIRLLNVFSRRMASGQGDYLDLILVTRGGGSLEDLWAFNEEVVARAIFNSSLPVVSAVGHEIDFTISDFVADLRAATPSAAAELITEGVFSSCEFVASAGERLRELLRQQLIEKHERLQSVQQRLWRLHPRRRINDLLQRLDELTISTGRCVRSGVRRHRLLAQALSERLARVRPANLLKQRRELFLQTRERLREQVRHRVRESTQKLEAVSSRLRLLGPEQVLARGYSITFDAVTGVVVRDAAVLKPGQLLQTRLKTGQVTSRVDSEEVLRGTPRAP